MSSRTIALVAFFLAVGVVVWTIAGGPAQRPSDVPLSPEAGAEALPSGEALSPGATGSR